MRKSVNMLQNILMENNESNNKRFNNAIERGNTLDNILSKSHRNFKNINYNFKQSLNNFNVNQSLKRIGLLKNSSAITNSRTSRASIMKCPVFSKEATERSILDLSQTKSHPDLIVEKKKIEYKNETILKTLTERNGPLISQKKFYPKEISKSVSKNPSVTNLEAITSIKHLLHHLKDKKNIFLKDRSANDIQSLKSILNKKLPVKVQK